jgi:hypothetical protein
MSTYRLAATKIEDTMTESDRLAAELAALEKEGAELDAEDGLTAQDRELRAKIRATKLENIAKRAAKRHGRVWPVDLDNKGTLPETVLFQGQQCNLHTQFVVRGAESKEWNDYSADIRAIDDEDPKRVTKIEAITRSLVIKCLVSPSNGERSHAEHSLDLAASFDRFPLIEKTLSDEIARLGGMILADKRKSVG